MGNTIAKHRKGLWYWLSATCIFLVLFVSGIGILYPFTIPVFVAVSIAVYFNYIRQKPADKKPEEKPEKKPEPTEPIKVVHTFEPPEKPKPIIVPKPPTPYFAHSYPLQKNFTGRIKERKELTDWLDNDSHPVFVYSAIGGMGKSALAWYWLNEDILKLELPPEGVIWWSFYDKEAGFENFLNHAIEYASSGETNPKDIASSRDKMEKLHSLLSEKRFLFILDGVERVLRAYAGMGSPYQGDEVKKDEKKDYKKCIDSNCEIFLETLAGIPKTKTLITTRICPEELDELEGVKYKKLTQMDKADAVEFFERQGVKGTRAEIEEVCDAYGYHPLCLRLLSGMIVKDMKYGGDIKAWTRHNPIPKLVPKEHHILELAYGSLGKKKQVLISKISAFRNPMDYDSLLIFNDFESEEKFNDVLIELTDRGLLFRDEKHNKFDLHPIVRKYCYDRLIEKKENNSKLRDYFAKIPYLNRFFQSEQIKVHSKLRDYFKEIPAPAKVESVDDLAPVIELYHHTVRAGRYDEAMDLSYNRLCPKPLHFKFGAYQTIIELLRSLFPDGEYKLPRLKNESAQAWTLAALANSYALSGQPRKAVPLVETANKLAEKQGVKENLAVCLDNLALNQIQIGELNTAESNLRRRIEIFCEIKYEFKEAVGHQELGGLLAYMGNFEESKKELDTSLDLFTKLNKVQDQCGTWAYYSLHSILMSDAYGALNSAEKSRELADIEHREIDIIRAEYLLSAAYIMKGNLIQAETHLTDALTRDRKINLVELESDILLEFAKLRFRQNHKEESLKHAQEALRIADHCEYRLKQADIHNFLAEFYFNSGNKEKAKEHAVIAAERASCGYVPALEKANKILNKISISI